MAAEAELAAASSQAAAAGGAEVEALRQKLADQSAAQQRAAAAAEEQQQKLRDRLNAAEAQSAAAVAGLPPAAAAPAASAGGGATYGSNLDDDDAGGDELDVRAAPAAPDSGGGPAVTALSLGGDATLGGTLLAMPTLDGADLADCVFAWFRGATLLPYADASALPLSVEDVGQVMAVEVTPISADGSEGAAVRAESTPISLSADVHRALRSYIDRGECPFAGCIDGERERTLLFTRDKLKVRDGKSTAFKDNYQATQLALSPGRRRRLRARDAVGRQEGGRAAPPPRRERGAPRHAVPDVPVVRDERRLPRARARRPRDGGRARHRPRLAAPRRRPAEPDVVGGAEPDGVGGVGAGVVVALEARRPRRDGDREQAHALLQPEQEEVIGMGQCVLTLNFILIVARATRRPRLGLCRSRRR